MHDWDQVAWLCAHIPSFSKKRHSISDFHPLRKKDKQALLGKISKQMEAWRGRLAKTLTPEELEAKWQAYKSGGNKPKKEVKVTHGG